MKTARKYAIVLMSVLATLPCISLGAANAESLNDQAEKESTRGTVYPGLWYPANPVTGDSSNGLFQYMRYSNGVGDTEIRHYLSGSKMLAIQNNRLNSNNSQIGSHYYSAVQPYNAEISSSIADAYYIEHKAWIYSGVTNTGQYLNYYSKKSNL